MATVNPFIFREYDIRGVVETELTAAVVEALGKGLGTYFLRKAVNKISVGGDVRLHTEQLRASLLKGLVSTGMKVVDLGAVPTGMQYFSLYQL
ncbi:MAG: phosphomannomutase, partial [Calditrichaeota bacterium]|nr:phosphomannomutase [Calditrichota bacterium]